MDNLPSTESKSKPVWTDLELIGYAEIHCETPRALFSAEHANRMIDLAGNPPGYSKVRGWVTAHEDMAHLCKLARERLKSEKTSDFPQTHNQLALPSQNGSVVVDFGLRHARAVNAPSDQAKAMAATIAARASSEKCDVCRSPLGTLHDPSCVSHGLVGKAMTSASYLEKDPVAYMTADRRMLVFADKLEELSGQKRHEGMLPLVHAGSGDLLPHEVAVVEEAARLLSASGNHNTADQLLTIAARRMPCIDKSSA